MGNQNIFAPAAKISSRSVKKSFDPTQEPIFFDLRGVPHKTPTRRLCHSEHSEESLKSLLINSIFIAILPPQPAMAGCGGEHGNI